VLQLQNNAIFTQPALAYSVQYETNGSLDSLNIIFKTKTVIDGMQLESDKV